MTVTFNRMSFQEASALLNSLCLLNDGKAASTNKRPGGPNPEAAQESWWLENNGTCPPFDSPRCKAYLRAYVEIAGPVFYGTGIPLKRGLLHPDRAVMKAMLLADCVTLGKSRPGLFELTQKGSNLIEGVAISDKAE